VVERILTLGKGEAPPRPATAEQRELTEVERLVARTANVASDRVWPAAQLSADIGLDSLGRVDLLGVIEEATGVYIADAALDPARAPAATAADLGRMVAAARDNKPGTGIFGWPLSPLVRSLGLLLQQIVVWPLVTIFYRVHVSGTEKLRELRGPVMFAPNHCL